MPTAGLIVTVAVAEPEPIRSVACTVTLKLGESLASGVPVRFTLLPVVESSEKPAGGVPTIDHVHNIQGSAASVAVKFREYGVPTSPWGGVALVTTGCPQATPPPTAAITTAPAHLRKVRIMRAPGSG